VVDGKPGFTFGIGTFEAIGSSGLTKILK